jgi:hypothetical protein
MQGVPHSAFQLVANDRRACSLLGNLVRKTVSDFSNSGGDGRVGQSCEEQARAWARISSVAGNGDSGYDDKNMGGCGAARFVAKEALAHSST